MNKRKFKRKATKGVLDTQGSLRYLYCVGSYVAERPDHPVINLLVDRELVVRDGSNLSLSEEGIEYCKARYPHLEQYTPPMSFEDWLDENDDEVTCYAAESGADREYGYDREELEQWMYDEYLEAAKSKV